MFLFKTEMQAQCLFKAIYDSGHKSENSRYAAPNLSRSLRIFTFYPFLFVFMFSFSVLHWLGYSYAARILSTARLNCFPFVKNGINS